MNRSNSKTEREERVESYENKSVAADLPWKQHYGEGGGVCVLSSQVGVYQNFRRLMTGGRVVGGPLLTQCVGKRYKRAPMEKDSEQLS